MGIIGKSFNDVGGTSDKLRRLAAHLMLAGGNDTGNALLGELQQRSMDAMRQQQLEQEQAYRDAQIAHMNAPDPVNLGNGGFATYDPEHGLNVLREPSKQENPYLWNWQGGAFRFNPETGQTETLREPAPMPKFQSIPQGDSTVTYQMVPGKTPSIIGKAPRWQPKAPAKAPAAKLPSGFILDR